MKTVLNLCDVSLELVGRDMYGIGVRFDAFFKIKNLSQPYWRYPKCYCRAIVRSFILMNFCLIAYC